MSKYIKLEDAINLFSRSGEYHADAIVDMLFFLPTIEVSEDAISREWAINKQREMIDLYAPHKAVEGRGQVYWQIEERELVVKELEHAPSVIPQQKEGEWIYIDEPIIGNPYGRYRCSECELDEPHETPYCPNCGAKMKGADYDSNSI